MIPDTLTVEKYHMLIEKGDEMVRFVEGLDEINRANDAEGLPMVFTASKEESEDLKIGKYSFLAVSKFGLDPENPKRAIRISEYIPINIKGEIIQESHQLVRHASIVLQAKGIARYQQKRGIKLRAAPMNNIQFDFNIEPETELKTHALCGEDIKTAVKLEKV